MTDLAEYAREGGELREIVANYEWRPETSEGTSYGVVIKIRVYKLPDGSFMAWPSHKVKTPGQSSPYMSLTYKGSIEEAVIDCISGFRMFQGTIEETTWLENEDF